MTDDERGLPILVATSLAKLDQGCAKPGQVSRFAQKVAELTASITTAARRSPPTRGWDHEQ
jgi:hypothetical protein